MKRLKQKRIIGLTIVAVVLLVFVVVITLRANGKKTATIQPSASPSIVKGNSTHDEPSSSPTATPTLSPPAGRVTLAKPSLQKSSGNAPGSSVPSGAVVEFSCEGTEGLACEITLTDRKNSSRVIKLPKKTITNNGRGQYFAIFDWTAVSGSWDVVAGVNDQSGNSAVSNAQTLEVK